MICCMRCQQRWHKTGYQNNNCIWLKLGLQPLIRSHTQPHTARATLQTLFLSYVLNCVKHTALILGLDINSVLTLDWESMTSSLNHGWERSLSSSVWKHLIPETPTALVFNCFFVYNNFDDIWPLGGGCSSSSDPLSLVKLGEAVAQVRF